MIRKISAVILFSFLIAMPVLSQQGKKLAPKAISVAYCVEDNGGRYLAVAVVEADDTGTVTLHDRQTSAVVRTTGATFGRDGEVIYISSATDGQTFAFYGKWRADTSGLGEISYSEFAPSQVQIRVVDAEMFGSDCSVD